MQFTATRWQTIGLAVMAIGLANVIASDALAQGGKGKGGGGGTSTPYDLFRLTVPGATAGSPWALYCNDSANVVGRYKDSGGVDHGFFYLHATRSYTDLGPMVQGIGLNQLNQLVGNDLLLGSGLYWSSPNATAIPLPPLPIHTHANARAINDTGIIIGSSFNEDPDAYWIEPGTLALVAWHVSAGGVVTGPVELPFLPGDWAGRVMAQSKQFGGVTTVVGSSGDTGAGPDESPLPVVWWLVLSSDSLQVVGPMVIEGNYLAGYAYGVNDLGTVVGNAALPTLHPFIKPFDQPLQWLPLLSNAVSGDAWSINSAGSTVGKQWVRPRPNATLQDRAVLWSSPSAVVDLNTQVQLGSGERLIQATDINASGDILTRNNQGQPCLLIKK